MYRESIMLSDIETIKKFVAFANRFEFPVTLFSDKYTVNGKSIMGIFGLDLTKPVEIEINNEYPSDFKEQLKSFQSSANEQIDDPCSSEFKEQLKTLQTAVNESINQL